MGPLLGFEKKQTVLGQGWVEINVPDLAETTTSVTLNNVDDGATLLVTVQHLPRATKERSSLLCTCSHTARVTQMPPGWAKGSIRAAILTPSP